MYRVIDPSTGRLVEEFPTATDSEIEEVLSRSHSGYTAWSQTTVYERTQILSRLADLYRQRAPQLAEIINREMGKSLPQGEGEVVLTSLVYRYYARNAERFLEDEELPGPKNARAYIRRKPVGSVLGIMPWNFPYYQVARFAAPNLALGNSIILKHAPNCPESSQVMESMLREAGLPADAYINVYATNEQVSDIILPSPLNHGVSLTGSERAGAAVAEAAGRNLKKVILELGGSDPYIVLAIDDLDETAETLFETRMLNTGQACNGPKRMIVHSSLYDEFVSRMVDKVKSITPADPYVDSSELSPLASSRAADTFVEQIRESVAQGATLHTGGERYPGPGAYVQPVVITGVGPETSVYREELFGPAVMIFCVESEEEAIELANDTPFGLGVAVFDTDTERAIRVGDQVESGMMFINTPEHSREYLPFGGVKRSGLGRELGPTAMDEFANRKLVYIPDGDD